MNCEPVLVSMFLSIASGNVLRPLINPDEVIVEIVIKVPGKAVTVKSAGVKVELFS